jgi:hypothetical protein
MMQRIVAAAAAGAVMSLAGLAPAGAQTWRTIDASRQSRDTNAVAAHIEYAAGKFDLKPAAGALLYSANVRYDADRAEPVADFDAASRVISLGVHLRGMHLSDSDDDHDAGSMHAELSGSVPMDLSLELGAVEADLQLGGLRLTDLSLRSGAADVTATSPTANNSAR